MPVSTDAIMAMPIFSPSGGPSNGLDLLASAATLNQPGAASLTPVMPGPRLGSLLGSGGYNPAETCEEDSGLGVRRCGQTHHRRGAIHARSSGPHSPRHRHLSVGGKVRSHGGNPGHTLPGEGA